MYRHVKSSTVFGQFWMLKYRFISEFNSGAPDMGSEMDQDGITCRASNTQDNPNPHAAPCQEDHQHQRKPASRMRDRVKPLDIDGETVVNKRTNVSVYTLNISVNRGIGFPASSTFKA